MTLALLTLAALLVGLLAYRLAKLPAALAARSQAQALTGQIAPPLAQQYANMPWVAQLAASAATSQTTQTTGDPAPLTAADWYDPTATSYVQTFNEYGFITSPSPAPVNPKTGRVPLTNADVCAWVGHMPAAAGVCPRCGISLPT